MLSPPSFAIQKEVTGFLLKPVPSFVTFTIKYYSAHLASTSAASWTIFDMGMSRTPTTILSH